MGQSSSACQQLWQGMLDEPGSNHTDFIATVDEAVKVGFSVVDTTITVTYESCSAVCRGSVSIYDWPDITGLATTWTVPLLGLLYQVPFESHEPRSNIRVCLRWIASPPCTLTQVLQRIKADRECAAMADQAAGDESSAGFLADYHRRRDSFLILSVMNHYTIQPGLPAAEMKRLLAAALFDDGRGRNAEAVTVLRSRVARELRKWHRKGAVPIFISVLVFLFVLAIAVENGEFAVLTTPFEASLTNPKQCLRVPPCKASILAASWPGFPSSSCAA